MFWLLETFLWKKRIYCSLAQKNSVDALSSTTRLLHQVDSTTTSITRQDSKKRAILFFATMHIINHETMGDILGKDGRILSIYRYSASILINLRKKKKTKHPLDEIFCFVLFYLFKKTESNPFTVCYAKSPDKFHSNPDDTLDWFWISKVVVVVVSWWVLMISKSILWLNQ